MSPEDKQTLLRRYLRGDLVKLIAYDLSVTPQYVSRLARKLGADVLRRHTVITPIMRREICRLYQTPLHYSAIARRFSIGNTRVLQTILEEGLAPRKPKAVKHWLKSPSTSTPKISNGSSEPRAGVGASEFGNW